jgi:hypothetical protein
MFGKKCFSPLKVDYVALVRMIVIFCRVEMKLLLITPLISSTFCYTNINRQENKT